MLRPDVPNSRSNIFGNRNPNSFELNLAFILRLLGDSYYISPRILFVTFSIFIFGSLFIPFGSCTFHFWYYLFILKFDLIWSLFDFWYLFRFFSYFLKMYFYFMVLYRLFVLFCFLLLFKIFDTVLLNYVMFCIFGTFFICCNFLVLLELKVLYSHPLRFLYITF